MMKFLFAAFLLPTALLAEESDWTPLLDAELSKWEVYIGIPHTTVEGLGEHPTSENVQGKGTPLGLNNDPKKVFTTEQVDGETVLKITGEIYGGLTTLEEFSDYHIRMECRWGEKKWEPRLEKQRDSGLLYHCVGDHGSFWKVWMTSLELQIQEKDIGDFYALAGTSTSIRADVPEKGKPIYDAAKEPVLFGVKGEDGKSFGSCRRSVNMEKPNGEWNVVEVKTVGDESWHIVNGTVVMILKDNAVKDGEGRVPLTKGKIQIQSEGAEIEYRRVEIRAITSLDE